MPFLRLSVPDELEQLATILPQLRQDTVIAIGDWRLTLAEAPPRRFWLARGSDIRLLPARNAAAAIRRCLGDTP